MGVLANSPNILELCALATGEHQKRRFAQGLEKNRTFRANCSRRDIGPTANDASCMNGAAAR